MRIDSDPLHAIQLAPGIKFIANTKNGWQPYLGVNMVWNVLDKQKVMANDVRLPEMSIKPYVEYGVGVQKCFKNDNFTAFGQAMVHNGGRNGISLSAGLRFRVGHNPAPAKVKADSKAGSDVASVKDKSEKVKATAETKAATDKKTYSSAFPRIKVFNKTLGS